jgi:4'-phosphopantetheinyl transferase
MTAAGSLGPNDVHVWCLSTAEREGETSVADVSRLSPAERARHDHLAFAHSRRDFAAAHALLRTALSRYADCPPEAWSFVAGDREKPRLSDVSRAIAPLSFNLSHTRGLVACAVAAAGEVGIDVESADRPAEPGDLAARFFSPDEVEHLQACALAEQRVRFTELWTLKEAFLKALGVGLAMPLGAMFFDLRDSGSIRFTPPPDVAPARWHFAVFAATERHFMSVAVRRDPAPSPLSVTARWADGSDTVLPARRQSPNAALCTS